MAGDSFVGHLAKRKRRAPGSFGTPEALAEAPVQGSHAVFTVLPTLARRQAAAWLALTLAALLPLLLLSACGDDGEDPTPTLARTGEARTATPQRTPTPPSEGTPTDTDRRPTATLSPGQPTATPPGEPPPEVTLPPGVPILPPDGAQAASGLGAQVGCDNRGLPFAQLSWTPAASRGSEQRVQVTLSGFEGSQAEVSDPLPPDRSSFRWVRLHGQAIHSWRVLTRHAEGWAPSETRTFQGPTCPVDIVG